MHTSTNPHSLQNLVKRPPRWLKDHNGYLHNGYLQWRFTMDIYKGNMCYGQVTTNLWTYEVMSTFCYYRFTTKHTILTHAQTYRILFTSSSWYLTFKLYEGKLKPQMWWRGMSKGKQQFEELTGLTLSDCDDLLVIYVTWWPVLKGDIQVTVFFPPEPND